MLPDADLMFRQALGCRTHCIFAGIAGSYSGALPPLRACLADGDNVWKPRSARLAFVPGVTYDWAVNASDCVDSTYPHGLYGPESADVPTVSPIWSFSAVHQFNASADAFSDTFATASLTATAESYASSNYLSKSPPLTHLLLQPTLLILLPRLCFLILSLLCLLVPRGIVSCPRLTASPTRSGAFLRFGVAKNCVSQVPHAERFGQSVS